MDSLVRVCSRQFRPQSRSLSHNARQKISRCVPSENSKPNRYPTTSKNRQCEVAHLGQCTSGSMHLATTPLWPSPEGHTSAIVARKSKAACSWAVPAGCTSHKAAINAFAAKLASPRKERIGCSPAVGAPGGAAEWSTWSKVVVAQAARSVARSLLPPKTPRRVLMTGRGRCNFCGAGLGTPQNVADR